MTSTRLNELFDYKGGQLLRKSGQKKVGTSNGNGYIVVTINKMRVCLHHIVWCMHKGYWADQLDHIDRDKSNNRIENLRECNKSLNEANTGLRRNNSSGYKGVAFHKKAQKFRAYLKDQHLGLFETPELAAVAYNSAAYKAYGDFAYMNEVTY